MLRWLIRRKLDSEEKKLGESVDYRRIPPTVKRTLGYAKSCSLVPVAVR